MKHLLSLVLLASLLLSCRPPKSGVEAQESYSGSGVSVRAEVAAEPTVGPAEVLVYVLEDNAAVSGAEVTVTGTMTHAGMEPVIAEATETEAGLYRTQGFAFDMAGDWLVSAEVTLPDSAEATDEVAVRVSGG